jgi:hypothetical protein
MKCFRHSSRHTAVSELGERAADPETIPGSPIADQSTGSNEVSLAAAVGRRSGE